jgi:hypothetical protein
MTNTRPNIQFNKEGICFPCLNFEKQKKTDWSERWIELEDLCKKYRRNGKYDCVIAISSGKDSYYLVYLFKNILKMNPLGIMIDNFSWTNTGRKNFDNLSEQFGIDILTFTPNRKEMKRRMKEDFFKELHPNKYWDEILYRKPLELAKKLNIKLVVWGENTSFETGGLHWKETSNAKLLLEDPSEFPELEVIFTSYYIPWSRYKNIKIAKKNGFKDLTDTREWFRMGFDTMFESEQIDTISYLVNQYCKFIKFGFSNMTEFCSDAIRHDKMTRNQAIDAVNECDWVLDYKMLMDFCRGLKITEFDFWETIDKFANRELLEKKEGMWRLKNEAE